MGLRCVLIGSSEYSSVQFSI